MTPCRCFPSLLLGVWMLSWAEPLPGTGRGGALESIPLAAPGVVVGERFTSLAPAATGIDFRSFLKRPHHIPFLNTGAGVAVGDVDGDGWSDVYLLSTDSRNRLYRQVAPWRFEDVTERAGVDGLSVLLLGDGRGGFRVASPADTGLLVAGDGKGLGIADFDDDGWPDVVVSQNNDALLAFRNRGVPDRRPFAVRLRGRPGNPTAVGARVSLVRAGGERQTAEVYAGSGYLSQSSPTLFFGLGEEEAPVAVEVRWPGGEHTRHTPEPGSRQLLIEALAAVGPAP